jgi:sulfatase modifying factor 1
VRPLSTPLFAAAMVLAPSPSARALRPGEAQAWSAGLDAPTASAWAQGVAALRLAPGGRVRIPGGIFTMGASPAALQRAMERCRGEALGPSRCEAQWTLARLNAEGPPHAVTLSSFDMDRTEVTVGAYARCVSAGACAPPDLTAEAARAARPDFPVTRVRWEDAGAYCRWAGGRLPTEAEWEYAAAGSEGREFPWGRFYNPHLSNHGALADDETDASDGFTGVAPVGSFPDGATPLGLLDVAGNVSEWVADVLELDPATDLPRPYDGGPQVNPPAKTGGPFHVIRGGSFLDDTMWLRSTARDACTMDRGRLIPSPVASWVGFRCAADAP